ncbi:helix-turn-helix domain-containing protein [Mesobacillus jeotgali]|uniref:helix-turn-helix domain-containing protein n=1 Tax=Mesobacillus jeotgali TaxID=129985 RepID=UPI000C827EA9|nr:helix-turn-helix domain-containing protein [Mesobacillus jeotgali]
MIKITGSKERMKGNHCFMEGRFEQVPHSIQNYMKYRVMSGNDLNIYLFLYRYDRNGYSYAYPTINQIAVETGLSTKTVKESVKNLDRLGLIRKGKSSYHPNKNVYYIDLPLSLDELTKQLPEKVIADYEERKANLESEAQGDKERHENHLAKIEKVNKSSTAAINKTVSSSEDDYYKQLEEKAERKMLKDLKAMGYKGNCD